MDRSIQLRCRIRASWRNHTRRARVRANTNRARQQPIRREEGVAGLWAGWSAYFVLALKPAIEYAVYEQVGALYHSLHDCC
jgi:hypothetical protein